MALVDGYVSFHGKDPKFQESLRFDVPRSGLVRLGKAIAIEYRCDKLNGGGDGTQATYRHRFETPVYLYMDESCKRQLYIIGEKLKVTDAGIEN